MSPSLEVKAVEHPRPLSVASALPQDSTFRFLVDRVRECIEAKILVASDPEQLAVLIWAHVHGLVSLRLSGHLGPLGDDEGFSRLYRASVAQLLRGLAG